MTGGSKIPLPTLFDDSKNMKSHSLLSRARALEHRLNHRTLSIGILIASMAIFFAFGIFHLGTFETTDEHLWKYGRIGQYWNAIAERDWEKTYINDKPGVTVALISGIGLLREPHPEDTVHRTQPRGESSLFEAYQSDRSANVNTAFRFPILVFSVLSLPVFFLLIFYAFGSRLTAVFGTIFIATNPILIGMAQIINPDSFFWIFGGLSLLAWVALQRTNQTRFLLLCGIFTGFALLSKYTAFTLFLFYGLFSMADMIFRYSTRTNRENFNILLRLGSRLAIVFSLAALLFAIFLPATFLHPAYFFKGISQFFGAHHPLIFLLGIGLSLFLLFIARHTIRSVCSFIAIRQRIFLLGILALFLILFIAAITNAWTGEHLVPVSQLRDQAYANEPKEFNFKPLLDRKDSSVQTTLSLFLLEAYPLLFSLPSLIILLLFILFIRLRSHSLSNNHTSAFVFSALAFTLLYICATQSAHVVTNARYLIILYPIFAILGAVILTELLTHASANRNTWRRWLPFLLLISGILTLWSIKPFQFSYTNFFLLRSLSVHDSWGHGSYEAAQYLNSLPQASEIIIWSNSDTVCRFFVGRCLRSRHIDLAQVTPHYFVISKRGVTKQGNRFTLLNNPHPQRDSDFYFQQLEKNAAWELLIDNRPSNFIKIIPFQP